MKVIGKYRLLRDTFGVERIATGYRLGGRSGLELFDGSGERSGLALGDDGQMVRMSDSELVATVNLTTKLIFIGGKQTGFYFGGQGALQVYYNSSWDGFNGQD